MEIEDYNYEKNSNTISKEERDAFIGRFKRACRAKGMTVQQFRTFVMHYDKQLQRIAREYNLPPITSYVARHSWASFASELDIQRDVISYALGHHVNVTDTYIRFNFSKVDEANRRVIDYLLEKG